MTAEKSGEALVELALNTASCSQKELAVKLGVSPTQISKWKKGEHMSTEMEKKLRLVAEIGDKDPLFVLWSGSLKSAVKWEKLICFLGELADEGSETGYDTPPLREDIDMLCWQTFYTLREMGVTLPDQFPVDLDIDFENDSDEDPISDRIDANPYASLIFEIYRSFANVYGFYLAYVEELIFDKALDLWGDVGGEIESCLLQLAASKLPVDDVRSLAPSFLQFKRRIESNYDKWLNVVKQRAYRSGMPLRAELLDLVNRSDRTLAYNAEAESLGFNKGRLHPDVYMDELLQGMRVIHQVLPAIMQKLGIDEFKLDTSDLTLHPDPDDSK
jgi:transcriptional regulator with XRE-family HTH domain